MKYANELHKRTHGNDQCVSSQKRHDLTTYSGGIRWVVRIPPILKVNCPKILQLIFYKIVSDQLNSCSSPFQNSRCAPDGYSYLHTYVHMGT